MEVKTEVGKLIHIYITPISNICFGKRWGFTYDLIFMLLQSMKHHLVFTHIFPMQLLLSHQHLDHHNFLSTKILQSELRL